MSLINIFVFDFCGMILQTFDDVYLITIDLILFIENLDILLSR